MNPAGEPSPTAESVGTSYGATTIRALLDQLPRPIRDRLQPSSVGSRLARAMLWSTVGTAVSRVLTLATFVIVARILGKAAFGEWGILRATVAGFQIVAGFGLGTTATTYVAQFRRTDPKRAGRVLAMTGLTTLATGAAAALLLILLAPWLAARTLGASHLAGELRICGALLFLSGVQAWQFGALAGLEAFKAATRVEFWTGVVSFTLTVAGALAAGLAGALWGMLASWTIRTVLAHLALRAETTRANIRPILQECLGELRFLWSFSLPEFLATAVVGPTLWFVQALLVNQPDGYRAMADFTAAHQWRMALSTLPGLLCAGYLPVAASLGRSAPGRSRRMMLGVAGISGAVTLVAALVVALFSAHILGVYGDGFASATPVFLLILCLAVIDSVNVVLISALLAAERVWRRLGANVWWALVLTASSWILVPSHGALGLAIAMLVAQALHLVIQLPLALAALPRTSHVLYSPAPGRVQ